MRSQHNVSRQDAMDAAWEKISDSSNRIMQADHLRIMTRFDLANVILAYINASPRPCDGADGIEEKR